MRWEQLNSCFHEVLVAEQASPWTMMVLRLLMRRGERARRYAFGLADSGRGVHVERPEIVEPAMVGLQAWRARSRPTSAPRMTCSCVHWTRASRRPARIR